MVQVTDWILATVSIVEAVATFALVYFAAVTINEAKNDRKKATIERKLEKIYFPMLEILDRARNEKARAIVRTSVVKRADSNDAGAEWAFVLTSQEFEEIRRMVERFGYYLSATELGRLRSDFETHEFAGSFSDMQTGSAPWIRLRTDVFDEHWRYFKSNCEKLTVELERLTGIKNG
ncbi:MAG: hypothetical protein ABSF82_05585 [Candidatus Bathyarchaeia archaeon]